MNTRGESMTNFRGAPTRSTLLHSAPPMMSGGHMMDHGRRQMRGDEEVAPPSQNLWVGNVATDMTEGMLMETFAKFGDIDSITAYPHRNYAFVYFKRIEHARAAKEGLQGAPLGGSPLKIEFARPAKPSKHLWVGGISQTVAKEQLEAEFLKFGRVEEFKFLRDRNSALVDYSNLEGAVSAVKYLNGRQLGGDPLRVDFLRSQPVKRESVANAYLHTVDIRDNRNSEQRILMGTTDLMRRTFDMMVNPPQSPQDIFPKVQTAHGLEGGRKQGGPSNTLWIGFPPSVRIDEQRLHNALILFGEIEWIKSSTSRHYSLVEFRSVDEARRAKDGLQGRLFNDPRIQILFSNSDFGPPDNAIDNASFMTPLRGMPLPDTPYRSGSQFGSIERLGPLGPVEPGNSPGINMNARPVGPRIFAEQHIPEARISFSRQEQFQNFSDTNINSPRSSGWSKPPLPLGLQPGAWNEYDANASQRELKRPRVNEVYPLPRRLNIRKPGDDGAGPLTGYYGPQAQRTTPDYMNASKDSEVIGFQENRGLHVNGSNQVLAGPVHMAPKSAFVRSVRYAGQGEHYGVVGADWSWQGTISKGGTPVCHARCIPIGKGIDAKFPEVVNCSARTDLDMLAKHFSQASDFGLVYFLPAGDQDVHTYQEFLHYLGSKHRAGVAKFSDGTTLFLVPPSDFSEQILKVPDTDRLFGVVLKFLQQPGNAVYQNPSNAMPHDSSQQYVQRQHFPILQVDHTRIPLKDGPTQFNTGMPTTFSPPKTLHTEQIAPPQNTNQVSGPQLSNVSLTPELIATLSSLLPNAFQASGSSASLLVSSSSTRPDPYNLTSVYDVSTSNGQGSSPRPSELWRQHQLSSPLPSHQLRPDQGNYQFQPQPNNQSSFSPMATVTIPSFNNTVDQSGQGSAVNPNFQDSNMKVGFTGEGSSVLDQSRDVHSGQLTTSHGQDQYQQEAPFNSQKSYGQMLSTEVSGNTQLLVAPLQKSVSSRSSDYHVGGVSQTLPNVQVGSNEMNSKLSSHVQQLEGLGAALLGHNQDSSESEVDKNQRYQSTLQFAANLLLQLQQKQAENKSVAGSTQHQQ